MFELGQMQNVTIHIQTPPPPLQIEHGVTHISGKNYLYILPLFVGFLKV